MSAFGGPAGSVIAAVIGTGWTVYQDATSGPSAIDTTIANAKQDISNQFNSLTDQTENNGTAIKGNWGKLSTFGGLIRNGTLVWPDSTTQLRVAAITAYQTYLFDTLLPLTSYGIATWLMFAKENQPASWNPASGDYGYSTASTLYQKGNWVSSATYSCLYYVLSTFPFGSPVAQTAPQKLLAKLFGTDTSNEGDPQLGINGVNFYTNNPLRLQGWFCDGTHMPTPPFPGGI